MKLDELVATVIASQLKAAMARIEGRIEERVAHAVAAKPLPPFVAPGPWSAGRHAAQACVRHRNGIFAAVRDTDEEPGESTSWLPLVVGLADLAIDVSGRTLSIVARMSDGKTVGLSHALPVPLYRGTWSADEFFREHDMVTERGSVWIALCDSKGIKPGTENTGGHWRMAVKSGDRARMPKFQLDAAGTLTVTVGEQVSEVGSIRELLTESIREALPERFRT